MRTLALQAPVEENPTRYHTRTWLRDLQPNYRRLDSTVHFLLLFSRLSECGSQLQSHAHMARKLPSFPAANPPAIVLSTVRFHPVLKTALDLISCSFGFNFEAFLYGV
jgi:hypothetical protein